MKWMKQFGIILLVSFVGEVLEKWIPLPIPASIYGIILLFLCLKLRIIPHESVHETGKFLIEIMPLMFIPAAVGLLETWDVIAPAWLEYVAVTVLSTWIVMIISGVAKGIALGTASHAIGTAKAMELGEVEGAMSSLSIVVAGLITVIGATIFSHIM